MTNPPVPADPANPAGAWHMLPKDIRPGDRVWHYDTHAGMVWAEVERITYDRAGAMYVVKYVRTRATDLCHPRTRRQVRRAWEAWPVWHGTPPCLGCGRPARLVGGTAMLRHQDGCRVHARERAGLN